MLIKLLGFALLFGALAVVYLFEGQVQAPAQLPMLYWPAIVLTGVGPLGVMALSTNWRILFQTIWILLGESPERRAKRYHREAAYLQKTAENIYKEGPKVLEQAKPKKLSPFTKKVLERMELRLPMADIRGLLETERKDRKSVV